MPGMDVSRTDSAWRQALRNALRRRLTAGRLRAPLKALQTRECAHPSDIAEILVSFRNSKSGPDDPLLFNYAELLLRERYISSSDLLMALLKHSKYGTEKGDRAPPKRPIGLPSCEERIFLMLAQMHAQTELPKSALELHNLVLIIVQWLKTTSEHEMVKQIGGDATVDQQSFGMYEALGTLALHVLGNQSIRAVTKQRWWKGRRSEVVAEMENYDTTILHHINSQLAGKLQQLTRFPPYIELDDKGRPVFSKETVHSFIPEMPVTRSRAGLFIWLNAALAARPLTDDATTTSHLLNRFNGNNQQLVIDLLVATFDVLTNAMLRKEPRQNAKVIKSFLVNKVPLIIAGLPGVAADNCIQMALLPGGMISMDPLPPITAGANDVRELLKAARMEFLQACYLHGLMSESAVAAVLQDSVAMPRVTKLNKDTLVSQCASHISRLESYVDELDGYQGNAGAIAGCIIDTVRNLSAAKDTMSLKTVCSALVKRISRVDIIMQYTQPGILLLPLCELLNHWSHDQDQSEFTPQYEEFSSILLLVLATIHRYKLQSSDIGHIEGSFISNLMDNMSTSIATSELSNEQSAQLSKWVEGLYAVDEQGETSGIGDEVMRHCPPQDFYRLVPTLFEQSVLACRTRALTMNTFKGGLELLLEPFLLPSLIMGLGWLSSHSWEDHNDAQTLLQILDTLLNPSSSSQETLSTHRTILGMVASPLYESLQVLLRIQPGHKKASELSTKLQPLLNEQRTLDCRKSELDEWLQMESGLASHVQRGIRDLVNWAATSSNPPDPPPRYTYKEFAVACQVLEGDVLLNAIVAEITRSLDMAIALDVCTSLICAPVPFAVGMHHQTNTIGLTSKLRQSLQLSTENTQALLDRKETEAHALILLARQVRAQLQITQPAQIAPTMPIQTQTDADQIMQALGLEMTDDNADTDGRNASLPNIDLNTDPTDQQIANITADGENMQVDQGANNVMGNVDLSDLDFSMDQTSVNNMNQQTNMQDNDDDIFADLDMRGGMQMSDFDGFEGFG